MAAFVDSRCLHVVTNLGVADVVGEDPMPIAALAAEVGVGTQSLTRCSAPHDVGVFSVHGEEVAHNDAPRRLRSDHRLGLLETAQLTAIPTMDSVRSLEDAVRTGRVRERRSTTARVPRLPVRQSGRVGDRSMQPLLSLWVTYGRRTPIPAGGGVVPTD